MNDDLISRSALLADLREKGFLPAIVQRAIERAPAVDAVPVIRCRECKFRSSWMMNRNLRYICPESGMFPNGENDFCSYRKRKDGADNEP